MIRGALVALLELESDFAIAVTVARGDEIVRAALLHTPDVAIIDIDLPGLDGLTAAAELHERLPSCPTIILTSLGRPGHVSRALDAHVAGFLLKDAPPGQLADAVRAVAAGRRVIDPELTLAAWRSRENPLTPREREVLSLAALGSDSREIAAQLYLSRGTVRNYLTSAVTKLNARGRVDAIRIATEAGWLP